MKVKGDDVESWFPRSGFQDALIQYTGILRKLEDAIQKAPEASPSGTKLKEIYNQGVELFKEKGAPIQSAMFLAVQRLIASAGTVLVPWESFLVENEDVEAIKTR